MPAAPRPDEAAPRQGRGRSGESDVEARLDALLPRLFERWPRAVGRGISMLEDGGLGQRELIRRVYSHTGRARVLGITGPPGAGKSTLVDRLARACRARGETVAVLAVDPSSPYTGGAILGDRIRMQSLFTDPGIFIRSMATRGAMGGLARASRDAVDLLDAAGFDWVLVETVGVGQDEVDVVRTVDTVVVVTVPGMGDDIQAIKAGILEIADLFVVNKADRDGVERTVRELGTMLTLGDHGAWVQPILKTVATTGEGVDALLGEVARHRQFMEESGELVARRRSHLRLRVETILKERVVATADRVLGLDREVEAGFTEHIDPYRVADRLFSGVLHAGDAVAMDEAAGAAGDTGRAGEETS